MMKSREFKKIYHPKLGGYVYEHRGNGLIVDNIMKPLKAGLSTAANKAARAVVSKFSKGAKAKAKAAKAKISDSIRQEKSGDLIRQRLSRSRSRQSKSRTPQTSRGRSRGNAKMTRNEVNTLINNLIARS